MPDRINLEEQVNRLLALTQDPNRHWQEISPHRRPSGDLSFDKEFVTASKRWAVARATLFPERYDLAGLVPTHAVSPEDFPILSGFNGKDFGRWYSKALLEKLESQLRSTGPLRDLSRLLSVVVGENGRDTTFLPVTERSLGVDSRSTRYEGGGLSKVSVELPTGEEVALVAKRVPEVLDDLFTQELEIHQDLASLGLGDQITRPFATDDTKRLLTYGFLAGDLSSICDAPEEVKRRYLLEAIKPQLMMSFALARVLDKPKKGPAEERLAQRIYANPTTSDTLRASFLEKYVVRTSLVRESLIQGEVINPDSPKAKPIREQILQEAGRTGSLVSRLVASFSQAIGTDIDFLPEFPVHDDFTVYNVLVGREERTRDGGLILSDLRLHDIGLAYGPIQAPLFDMLLSAGADARTQEHVLNEVYRKLRDAHGHWRTPLQDSTDFMRGYDLVYAAKGLKFAALKKLQRINNDEDENAWREGDIAYALVLRKLQEIGRRNGSQREMDQFTDLLGEYNRTVLREIFREVPEIDLPTAMPGSSAGSSLDFVTALELGGLPTGRVDIVTDEHIAGANSPNLVETVKTRAVRGGVPRLDEIVETDNSTVREYLLQVDRSLATYLGEDFRAAMIHSLQGRRPYLRTLVDFVSDFAAGEDFLTLARDLEDVPAFSCPFGIHILERIVQVDSEMRGENITNRDLGNHITAQMYEVGFETVIASRIEMRGSPYRRRSSLEDKIRIRRAARVFASGIDPDFVLAVWSYHFASNQGSDTLEAIPDPIQDLIIQNLRGLGIQEDATHDIDLLWPEYLQAITRRAGRTVTEEIYPNLIDNEVSRLSNYSMAAAIGTGLIRAAHRIDDLILPLGKAASLGFIGAFGFVAVAALIAGMSDPRPINEMTPFRQRMNTHLREFFRTPIPLGLVAAAYVTATGLGALDFAVEHNAFGGEEDHRVSYQTPTDNHLLDIPWDRRYAAESRVATIIPKPGKPYVLDFDGKEFTLGVDPSLTGLHMNDDFVSFERGTNCAVGSEPLYCIDAFTYFEDTGELEFNVHRTYTTAQLENLKLPLHFNRDSTNSDLGSTPTTP